MHRGRAGTFAFKSPPVIICWRCRQALLGRSVNKKNRKFGGMHKVKDYINID